MQALNAAVLAISSAGFIVLPDSAGTRRASARTSSGVSAKTALSTDSTRRDQRVAQRVVPESKANWPGNLECHRMYQLTNQGQYAST